MRWIPGGRSRNLEDQRGAGPAGGFGGGGGGRRMGLGGLVVLIVLSVIFKKDLVSDFGGLSGGDPSATLPSARGDASLQDSTEEGMVLFMSSILDSAQTGWSRKLPGYRDAKLSLFRDAVQSACGFAEAASGPFYCPADQKVYLDLAFFDQLDRQFGAPGDFAQAYVLAHEIGHHVQNLMGTERELRDAQQRNPQLKNRLSVAMELQADCYAGVWAYQAAKNGQLERGDLEEGLSAAAAVGDDRLQRMGSGRVNAETFTHGSSADRTRWFKRGFDSGDPNQCDTFASVR
ncbi:MAG: zinc metallopeptidase [Gemmatimonadaceae bacterium]|nr:zinc metallopeptidase [Gemmatimonadaceae bacterium]